MFIFIYATQKYIFRLNFFSVSGLGVRLNHNKVYSAYHYFSKVSITFFVFKDNLKKNHWYKDDKLGSLF